jgi:glutathione S-transferase
MLEGKMKPKTPTPTIVGDYRSSYVRSARIGFEEKGIAYAFESASPQSPEVLSLNPFGRIPAFRCGDLTLYETSAILHYLEENFAGPPLMPASANERARVEQWISALNFEGYPAMIRSYVLQYLFPKGPDGKPDRKAIDPAIPQIRKIFGALDAAIGEREFLVGDALSLADVIMAPMVNSAAAMPEGKDLLGAFAGLRRALEKLTQRPSFVAATQAPAA